MTFGLRWSPRRLTAVAVCLLAAGFQLDGESAAHAQDADATSTYQCAFPSGTQQVGVHITGTFPATAGSGASIQPQNVTAAVTLPQAAVADLGATGGATVNGTAQLTTDIAKDGASTPTAWPGLHTSQTTSAADAGKDGVTLSFSGAVPPTTGSAGGVSFAADKLDLALTPVKADGSATNSSPVSVACTPTNGKAVTLASVAGTGQTSPQQPVTPAQVGGPMPEHCKDFYNNSKPPIGWNGGCVYIDGFSNVDKLKAATPINDGSFQDSVLTEMVYDVPVDGSAIQAKFQMAGPMRSRSTFLSFKFMPTTATIELTQVGTGTETAAPYPDDNTHQHVTGEMQTYIRVYDVTVNGAPLNVGPHCQTSVPADIKLTDTHTFTNIVRYGGTLQSTFTIPPLTGCGVGENLNPLLNAEIAGPGNYLRINQAGICYRNMVSGCPPVPPPLTPR